jgi:hypothetical protein
VSRRAPGFVLPPGGTLIDGTWLVAAAALYTAIGEPRYHEQKPIVHPEWGCTRARSDSNPAGAIALVAIYLVSTAILARRTAGRRAARTAVHVFAALAIGLTLADVYVWVRMETGAHCSVGIEFCTWCLEPAWYEHGLEIGAVSLMGSVAAPLVGWLARLPRRRRSA